MSKPLISIIIPTYNEEQNIERLLLSIKNQSYNPIETIIVDDGSVDKTVTIAKKYTNKVYKRKHAERSVQRNFGASKAKGRFLLFLDADMELSVGLLKDCIKIMESSDHKALIIPEKTAGNSWLAKVRRFERDMYEGDPSIEVARVFEKKTFNSLRGYDENLTGAEDYDLPIRLSKKNSIGWSKSYLIHHEEKLTLIKLLRKKYYYAGQSVSYASKHPELVAVQGTILFRRAYIKHWKEFVLHPVLGTSFIVVRILTLIVAVIGFIKAAGLKKFLKTFVTMLNIAMVKTR